jgi:hypothetical protein
VKLDDEQPRQVLDLIDFTRLLERPAGQADAVKIPGNRFGLANLG